MTPSPELQDHIKIAQRAALRNAQTFQMFTMMCAYGKKPEDALREAENAIDVWSEYEDAHAIEPPPETTLSGMMAKFGQMAERIGQNTDPEPFAAVDPDCFTHASVEYCERMVNRLEQLDPSAPCQLIADSTQEAYFAGAAQMLRLLHDVHTQPFPYYAGDLRGLLQGFGLLAAHPEAAEPSRQDQPTEKESS